MNRPLDAIPQHDRPREKLRARGAAALKDHELLAILIGKGTTRIDVMTLAENLVQAVDAKGLNLKVEDLEHLEGMGAVKAMIVVAALEFARRRIKPGGPRPAVSVVSDGDLGSRPPGGSSAIQPLSAWGASPSRCPPAPLDRPRRTIVFFRVQSHGGSC